jgi:hypothetical protein
MSTYDNYTNNKKKYLELIQIQTGGKLENLADKLSKNLKKPLLSDELSTATTTANDYASNSDNSSNFGGSDNSDSSDRDIPTGKLSEKNIVNIICKTLANYLKDDTQQPINYTSSIPIHINYIDESDLKIITTNCHMGQRKLLLTEIEFYARCIVDFKSKNNFVIYAGSASCEHLPVILSLFEGIKFLLVDPNYHSIEADYEYIYQNNSVISKNIHRLFTSYLQKQTSPKMQKIHKITKRMTEVQFVGDDEEHNVLDNSQEHYDKMKEFEHRFYNSDSFNPINDIFKSDKRVFIIQDYMTPRMIMRLRDHIDRLEKRPNIYFVTDIRTTLVGGPYDIDVLWNCALQTIFLKTIQPDYSMLKHRPPFFSDITVDIFKNQNKYPQLTGVFDDFDYVKKTYNEDFISRHLKGEFYYFDDSEVLVQPWAPKGSSETRLYLSKNQINKPFIKHDYKLHEGRMFAFKFIREYKYFPTYHEVVKKYSKNVWDGCQDCAREIYTYCMYLMIYGENNTKMDSGLRNIAITKITDKLSDETFFNKMFDIYNMVNKYTYYDLTSGNYKCPMHGIKPLIKQNNQIDFVITNNSTRLTTTLKFDVESNRITSEIKNPQTKQERLA